MIALRGEPRSLVGRQPCFAALVLLPGRRQHTARARSRVVFRVASGSCSTGTRVMPSAMRRSLVGCARRDSAGPPEAARGVT